MHTISLPSSKSLVLRHMILWACGTTPTTLHWVTLCDDIESMIQCLRTLWSHILYEKWTLTISPVWYDFGDRIVDLHDSWASMRFIAALAMINTSWTITLTGSLKLSQRPMQDQIDGMRQLWVVVHDALWCLPMDIVWWSVSGDRVSVSGATSSQYCSAFLLVASQLSQWLTIALVDDVVSKPYVDMTLATMSQYGISYTRDTYHSFLVPHQTYAWQEIIIEWDASAMSYWAAYILLHGWSLRIMNLGNNTSQWDYAFLDVCQELWLLVTSDGSSITLEANWLLSWYLLSWEGGGQTIDFTAMPDVSMTFMILALFIPWMTTLTWLQTLAHKESHRVQAMATELQKLWVEVLHTQDTITIGTLEITRINNYSENKKISIETYNDHRIAMSFGILKTYIHYLDVANPWCVAKTYPLFWEHIDQMWFTSV